MANQPPPAQCSNQRRLSLENPPGYFKKRKRERHFSKAPTIQHYLSSHCINLFIGLVIVTNFVNISATTTLEDDLKVLSLTTTPTTTTTSNNKHNDNTTNSNHICKTIEVRDKLKNFDLLRGCRVIEGSLNILMLDDPSFNESDYANISFPELYEITDYLLIYRMLPIKSLRNLFPNLSVIRGDFLFNNYALVIYECEHLEDVGFYNLQRIQRGGVRIENIKNLCYVHTIDWTAIGVKPEDFVPRNLKPQLFCSNCLKTTDSSNRTCHVRTYAEDYRDYFCWNKDMCQRKCNCGPDIACSHSGKCCSPECLGGCGDNDPKKCFACKNLDIGDKHAVCADRCEPGYYQYLNRRCISADECYELNNHTKKESQIPYIPVNVTCSKDDPKTCKGPTCQKGCPTDYSEDTSKDRITCKKCGTKCLRKCTARSIDSIAAAQELKGCSFIIGPLEISIKNNKASDAPGSSSIINELEKSLSDIEEISGYLKIVRSYPIVSLSFLKKLRKVHGEALEGENAIIIWDNPNLQALLNQNQTIEITHGKAFFYMNPKLCYQKIKEMIPDDRRFNDIETTIRSNGDKVPCNVIELIVTVQSLSASYAMLNWKGLRIGDERKLLRYVVYYMPTNENISIWDNREACGNDGWLSDDVNDFATKDEISYPLFRLEAHTRYAYYVQAFTLQSEKINAISQIRYFWTHPGKPQQVAPNEFKVTLKNSSSVSVEWVAPRKINGNFSHYVLVANQQPLPKIDRDYCVEPFRPEYKLPESTSGKSPMLPDKPDQETSCECDKCLKHCEKKEPDRQEDREAAIAFEDQIQNFVYKPVNNMDEADNIIDAIAARKAKRQTKEFTFKQEDAVVIKDTKELKNRLNKFKEFEYFRKVLYDIRNHSYTFNDLEHSQYYQISIQVCREKSNVSDDKSEPCSTETSVTVLTPDKPDADIVENVYVTVQSSNTSKSVGSLKVTWKGPPRPNGAVLAYNVHYRKTEGGHAEQPVCVTVKKDSNTNPETLINNLPSGNYSVRVSVISLSGNTGKHSMSAAAYGVIEEQTSYGNEIIIVILLVIFLFVIVIAALLYMNKRHADNITNIKLIASVNPDYAGINYKQDEWEVQRDKVIILQELGQGSFGMVYEGIVKDLRRKGIEELITEMRCAVKTVNEQATDKERSSFLLEASVMKQFDTAYVVKLLGVVSISQPTFVVMELMINGDLKGYLRSHRAEYNEDNSSEPLPQPPTIRQMLQMSAEIADGMSYLSAKKFVHRDLAARNCMVGDDLTVKIGDFGMTRDIYETDYYRKGTKGLLPVRWMSPESLKDGVFSTASDVFSYGVVLWEIATLASQPYQGFSNDQVLRYVIEGGVMERPENCPDRLYDLMRKCWQHRPSARPTFLEIIDSLRDVVNDSFKSSSHFFSKEGQDLFIQQRQGEFSINMTDDVTTPLTLRQDDDDMTSSIDGNNFLMGEISEERRRKLHDL